MKERGGENDTAALKIFESKLMVYRELEKSYKDIAYTFSDIAKYLVASQELEPGNGWLYSGWIGALAENPYIDPLELAKTIYDTFKQGCEAVGTQDNITLSETDLSKVADLVAAYNDLGKEAFAAAIENPAFFAHFLKLQTASKTTAEIPVNRVIRIWPIWEAWP